MYFLIATIIWLMSEAYVNLKLTKKDGQITETNSSRALEIGTLCLFLIAGSFYFLDAFTYSILSVGDPLINRIGLILVLLGIIYRQYSIYVLGKFFSGHIRFKEEHQLIKEGPYRWFRHPSYFGSFICYVGLGLASFSWISACLFPMVITFLYVYRTKVEEEMLETVFKEEYLKYKEKTWGFLPFIK